MSATPREVGEPVVEATTTAPRRPSRWWVAAAPLAVVTMLAAGGYRVPVFWWQSGQHHEIGGCFQPRGAIIAEMRAKIKL